jgi:hypothetical protein
MTFITQAIETKFIKATDTKPSRIKATAWAGSITISYDHALSTSGSHKAAANALIAKLRWTGTFAQGANVKGDGYYFVNVEGA